MAFEYPPDRGAGSAWCGLFFAWIGAFFAILLTGSNPRPLFEFDIGVLRWAWRVNFYIGRASRLAGTRPSASKTAPTTRRTLRWRTRKTSIDAWCSSSGSWRFDA